MHWLLEINNFDSQSRCAGGNSWLRRGGRAWCLHAVRRRSEYNTGSKDAEPDSLHSPDLKFHCRG